MSTQRLPRPDGEFLAYTATPGRAPAVVFLGGFRSEMTATKATALHDWAHATGRAFVRLDYFGHGQSSGRFEDGTVSRWRDDALAVIDELTSGPLVLVGSSMGGWLSLLAARERPGRLAGLVLVAPAPDFTERMLLAGLTPAQRATLERNGRIQVPSQYSPEPSVITRNLIEDGRKHLVLDEPLLVPCPVHLLHGQLDPDIDWQWSLTLAAHIQAPEVITTLIKDGDHRLSTPADIARLLHAVEAVVE